MPPPTPALSKTYFPMQAHNPASRPGGGYQLAQLCVLQPAGLPPGRPMGATRASCASAPRRPGARLEALLLRPAGLSSPPGPSVLELA